MLLKIVIFTINHGHHLWYMKFHIAKGACDTFFKKIVHGMGQKMLKTTALGIHIAEAISTG